jgi:endoribonuclease Dicer
LVKSTQLLDDIGSVEALDYLQEKAESVLNRHSDCRVDDNLANLKRSANLLIEAAKSFSLEYDEEAESVSAKLALLSDILYEFSAQIQENPNFRIIVFISMRRVVRELERKLKKNPKLAHLTLGVITGRGGKKKPSSSAPSPILREALLPNPGRGMKANEQLSAASSFRKGEANVLLATSVAEEGLDIPACNVVIRFDVIYHVIGLIQSRGRARNDNSSFILVRPT